MFDVENALPVAMHSDAIDHGGVSRVFHLHSDNHKKKEGPMANPSHSGLSKSKKSGIDSAVGRSNLQLNQRNQTRILKGKLPVASSCQISVGKTGVGTANPGSANDVVNRVVLHCDLESRCRLSEQSQSSGGTDYQYA